MQGKSERPSAMAVCVPDEVKICHDHDSVVRFRFLQLPNSTLTPFVVKAEFILSIHRSTRSLELPGENRGASGYS